MPTKINKLLNRLEEYISGRDISAEMQVELGSTSSIERNLIDVDAATESNHYHSISLPVPS